MKNLSLNGKKIVDSTPEAGKDPRFFQIDAGTWGIRYHGDRVKIVDHVPTPEDLKICNLRGDSETVRKGHETKRARKTAQDSLKFLLSCSAEPKEAADLIHVLTGGELSDTMRTFFNEQDGDESDLTQYDLINLAMITAAKKGDVKAAAYVRDTIGDKLAEKTETAITFTDGDKSLLEKVADRLDIDVTAYTPDK